MRVVVEETKADTENKRKTVVECEDDNIPVEETLDMIFRGLLAFGYTQEAIASGLQIMTSPPAEEDPKPEPELGEI